MADQGKGPGPPLFVDQTEAQRSEIFFFRLQLFSGSGNTRNARNTRSFQKVVEQLVESHISGAPNENIVQNHFNIALLNVF